MATRHGCGTNEQNKNAKHPFVHTIPLWSYSRINTLWTLGVKPTASSLLSSPPYSFARSTPSHHVSHSFHSTTNQALFLCVQRVQWQTEYLRRNIPNEDWEQASGSGLQIRPCLVIRKWVWDYWLNPWANSTLVSFPKLSTGWTFKTFHNSTKTHSQILTTEI